MGRPVGRRGTAAEPCVRTRTEADRYRSALLDAHAAGHAFDLETGEPIEWEPEPGDVQMHVWARAFLAEQWPDWAPRTRKSAVEALSRFVPLVVSPTAPPPPASTRQHLGSWLALNGEVVDDEAAAWLDRWCLSLSQLERALLAAADRQLARKADGPLSPPPRRIGSAPLQRAASAEPSTSASSTPTRGPRAHEVAHGRRRHERSAQPCAPCRIRRPWLGYSRR